MPAGPAFTNVPLRRPEWELLRLCARTHLDPPDKDRLQCLARNNLHFSKLMISATRHGVAPLLCHSLASLPPETLPAAFLHQLRAHAYLNAELNRRHARELVSILDLFSRHGIEALPFKGVVLALSVYGSLSLRKAGDLDILLRREEAVVARDLLLQNGYECCSELAAGVIADRFGPFELQLRRADGQVRIELRWKVTPPLFANLDLDLVRQYRQSAVLVGCHVPTLAPEENLILLCIHGCKHEWSRLMWICDVAELIRACPGLDWRRVRRHAEDFRLWRAVKLGLMVARDVLQAAIPPDISEEIVADSLVRRLAARVCLCLPGEIAGANPGRAIFDPQLLNSFPNWLQCRLHRWARLMAPTQRDREILRIPEPLSCLYYVLRPVRLGIEYGVLPLAHTLRGRRNQ